MSYATPAPDAQQLNNKHDAGSRAKEADSSDALRAHQRIQERIERTFSDPRYEPPKLPAVALELLELARRPDVEVRDVVSLLEKDPILASRLLRHVQSPLYAGGAEIRSLQRALTHLGLEHIRDIALELTVDARVFRAEHYAEAMDRVSKHSRLTAYLTQVVCRYAVYDASHAFLCGLLHDVGFAAGLIALGDVPRSEDRPDIAVALPVLLDMHVELGGQVAQSWGLSPEIVNVIRHHHELADSDGQVHQLAAVVCLAEHLANELGSSGIIASSGAGQPVFAQDRPRAHDQTSPQQIELAFKTLGLDAQKIQLIRADAAKVIVNLESPKSADINSATVIPMPKNTPAISASAPAVAGAGVVMPSGAVAPAGFWGRLRGIFGAG